MPDTALVGVVAIVVMALVFDYTNGFHDAANSIATVVTSSWRPTATCPSRTGW
jgi:inorganic phosphate transporter, PiT family